MPLLLKTPADEFLASYALSPDDIAPLEVALSRLEDAVAKEVTLTPVGVERIRRYVDSHLTRLSLLTADRNQHPEIASVQVASPIVITGAPRSGTTFLHSLMAQDPQHRAPLAWELEFPSPPPESDRLFDDPRVAQWERLQSGPNATHTHNLRDSDARKKHLIGALLPEECGRMLGTMLRNPTGPWSLARVTDFYDWVVNSQMREAYRVHKKWLQHLQWKSPRDSWLPKYPQHILALDHLTAAYPDVRIIQTHRTPEETVSSLASLIQTLRAGAFTREDPNALGQEMLNLQANSMQRSREYRALPGAKAIIDVSYRELLHDPMATVAKVYDRLQINLSVSAESKMNSFLLENPQGKLGVHRHNLEEYGLTQSEVRDRMRFYLDSFAEFL